MQSLSFVYFRYWHSLRAASTTSVGTFRNAPVPRVATTGSTPHSPRAAAAAR